MYYLKELCFLCLNNKYKLKQLLETSFDDISHYDKLISCLPEMKFTNQKTICEKCSMRLNDMYSFREMCLWNNCLVTDVATNNKFNELKINVEDIKEREINNEDVFKMIEVKVVDNSFEEIVSIQHIFRKSNNFVFNEEYEEKIHDSDYIVMKNETFEETDDFLHGVSIKKEPEEEELDFSINEKYISNFMEENTEINDDKNLLLSSPKIDQVTYELLDIKEEIFQNDPNVSETQENETLPEFTCNNCDQKFPTILNLNSHLLDRTCRIYKCEECDKTYKVRAELIRHEVVHSGKRPYKCKICRKGFLKEAHRIRHERSVHGGEKNYKCNDCNKTFPDFANLSRHELTHSEKRPYSCTVCKKAFKDSSFAKRHCKQVEKVFSCDICGKSFTKLSHLREHQSGVHEKLQVSCKICKKFFSKGSTFRRHIRTHRL